jgi:hypothetical protein
VPNHPAYHECPTDVADVRQLVYSVISMARVKAGCVPNKIAPACTPGGSKGLAVWPGPFDNPAAAQVHSALSMPRVKGLCAYSCRTDDSSLHSRRLARPGQLTWLYNIPAVAQVRGATHKAHIECTSRRVQWPCLAARVVSTNNPHDQQHSSTHRHALLKSMRSPNQPAVLLY